MALDQEETVMAKLRLWVKPRRTPAAFAMLLVRLIERALKLRSWRESDMAKRGSIVDNMRASDSNQLRSFTVP